MITDELLHKAYMLYPMIIPESNNKESLKDVEDINKDKREAYILGYLQAEIDLELTYDDICEIMEIREDVLEMDSYENLYEEVLKRFKEIKEQ